MSRPDRNSIGVCCSRAGCNRQPTGHASSTTCASSHCRLGEALGGADCRPHHEGNAAHNRGACRGCGEWGCMRGGAGLLSSVGFQGSFPGCMRASCSFVPPPAQIEYLASIGLKQDEICNMASISVVLLGLNPETRIRPVVEYLQRRGMPGGSQAWRARRGWAQRCLCNTSAARGMHSKGTGQQSSWGPLGILTSGCYHVLYSMDLGLLWCLTLMSQHAGLCSMLATKPASGSNPLSCGGCPACACICR
jgi:hypothetical protein